MQLYDLAIFLLLFAYFKKKGDAEITPLSSWTLPLTFALKVSVGGLFVYIYTYYYGNGILSEDAGVYMRESKIVHDVFYQSKLDYFKLLFGLDFDHQLTLQYLSETTNWDAGSQSVINENRVFIKFQSLIQFISFNRVSVHVMVMCAISTLAVKHLFIAIQQRTTLKSFYTFWLIALIPSVLFWTSGLAKEPLMLLGFGLLIRSLLDLHFSIKRKFFFGIVGIMLVLIFKSYVLLALVPPFIFCATYKLLPHLNGFFVFTISIFMIALFVFIFPGKRQSFVELTTRKQYDFNNVASGGIHAHLGNTFYFFSPEKRSALLIEGDHLQVIKPVTAVAYQHGDISHPKLIEFVPNEDKMFIYFQNERCHGYFDITPIENSFMQLIKNIPQALMNSLFRPFLFDEGGSMKYLAMLEMVLIYLGLAFAFFKRKTLEKKEIMLIVATWMFIFTLSLLIGWVTPVLGAIVRYRIPILLAIAFIAFILFNPPIKFKTNE